MPINIHKIAKLGWTKKWAGTFSLLTCFYNGKQDIQTNKKFLGDGFHNILFVHKKGVSSCYRLKSETDTFGKYLAEKVKENNSILRQWSLSLKHRSDKIRNIIKNPVNSFLNIKKYKIFEKAFDEFHPPLMAVYVVSDCLPLKLLKKYYPLLEEARKYSEPIYNETEIFFQNLAKCISEKEKYDPGLILSLFGEEIVEYLKTGNLPARRILEKRYKLSGLLMQENIQHTLSGSEIIELENLITRTKATGQITGKTAWPGKVKGICRVIHDPRKVEEFNKGDILITAMTRPDFIPFINKAVAIITDAGGILSHASIIAREMKKPCIVGTEVATKIFNDGDLVEVDASNGVAKKLKLK